jgi:hypothetical protein
VASALAQNASRSFCGKGPKNFSLQGAMLSQTRMPNSQRFGVFFQKEARPDVANVKRKAGWYYALRAAASRAC